MACLRPRRRSSSKSMASLPTLATAPSPRSSPSATLMMSAACTNSRILSLAVMPRRPASPASALSCSRLVRVSIFWRLSLRSSTSFFVRPVYFLTLALASSIVAYCWMYSSMKPFNAEKPSNAPLIVTTKPDHFLPTLSIKFPFAFSTAANSLSTILISSLVLFMASVSVFHSLLPLSTFPEFSCFVSSLRVARSCFGVALSRLRRVRAIPSARVSTLLISFCVLRSSLLYRSKAVASPFSKASSFFCFICMSFAFKSSSLLVACSLFTISWMVLMSLLVIIKSAVFSFQKYSTLSV